jgi:hypothetical protein
MEQASMAKTVRELKTAVAAIMVFTIRTYSKEGLSEEVEEMLYGKKGGQNE